MTRKDIYEVLDEIVLTGYEPEDNRIQTAPDATIAIGDFLNRFKDYDLTLSSLLEEESMWKSRFKDWNERGILPD